MGGIAGNEEEERKGREKQERGDGGREWWVVVELEGSIECKAPGTAYIRY